MALTKVKGHILADDLALGGNPTTSTQSTGNNTTRIATTAFVQTELSALVDSSPSALNTLNELAAALGDDENFSTTVNASIATKAPLASPTFTGTATAASLSAGSATFEGAAVNINILETNTTDVNTRFRLNSGDFIIQTLNDAQNAITNRLKVSNSTGDISFYEDTGTTAKFYWDASTESLGIGTTNPSATYSIDTVKGIRSSGAAPSFTLQETDTGNQTWLMASYGGTFAVRDTTVSGTAYPLQIQAATPSNTLFLKSDGKVGIGTTNPQGTFVVSNSGAGGFEFTPDTTSFSVANSNYIASYDRSSSAYRDIVIDLGGAESQAVRFKAGGNVGIGTTSPTEKLEVDGGVKISNSNSRLYFGAKGGTSYRALEGDTSGSLLQVGEGYADIALQGNVGIGTTSPQHDLVIHNDSGPFLSLIGDGYNDEMGIIFNGGDLTNASSAGNTGAKITSQLSVSGGQVLGDLRFTTNSGDTFVDAMRIDSDGNVGIGISSPGSYANDDNSLAVLGQVRIQGVTNTAAVPILALRDTNSGLFAPASNIVSISAGATERMFLTGTGRVHIGHTTRTGWDSLGTVVIQQAAATAGIGIVDEGGNNTLKIENNNTEAKFNHNSASAVIKIGTGGSDKLILDGTTGDVGIGTSPGNSYRLEVYDGDYTQLMLRAPTYPLLKFKADNQNSGNNSTIGMGASNSLVFSVNNTTTNMVLNNGGEVTTPNQPSFDVHTPSNTTGVIVYPSGNINLNRGSCYNATNGRFTAPVAGVYLFYTNFIKANLASTTCRRRFNKNGSALYSGRHIRLGGEGDNNYDWGSLQVVVSLAVNDYINVDQHQGTSYGAEYDSFGGYLIG